MVGVKLVMTGASEPTVNGAALETVPDGVDTEIMPALAAEYSFRNLIAFRIGKRFERDARTGDDDGLHGFATGAGVRLPIGNRRFLVDYAFRSSGDLESNHAFSFELSR